MDTSKIHNIAAYVWLWRIAQATGRMYVEGSFTNGEYTSVFAYCTREREAHISILDGAESTIAVLLERDLSSFNF